MELAEVLYSRRKLLIFTTPTEGQYKVMKTHLDIQHVGNLDGVRKRMTFDPDSVAHLMSVLTDLYSDTEKAVIREYSTNALDSHRRIGVNKPVQVTSPTELHRFFTVTDFGEGMDKDQLTDEFGSYGYSSNRDTDATTGMLGLGCKSGLSYTFQFTVTSRKDGVETLALVTREEDGAGAIEIIDTQVTSDPNGTTVEVPVKDVRSFTHKMDEFYQYWDTGDVLVDGVEPPCVWDDHVPSGRRHRDQTRHPDGADHGDGRCPLPRRRRHLGPGRCSPSELHAAELALWHGCPSADRVPRLRAEP
jgi:hypothetical protein